MFNFFKKTPTPTKLFPYSKTPKEKLRDCYEGDAANIISDVIQELRNRGFSDVEREHFDIKEIAKLIKSGKPLIINCPTPKLYPPIHCEDGNRG
jgi:hypothetical protein